jgi:hypothetical protein
MLFYAILLIYLHECFLERQELAELDGGREDGDGQHVVVVRVHREGRVERDVGITPKDSKSILS